MLPCFTGVLHVSNLQNGEHLMAVLEQSDCFNKQELINIGKKVNGRKVSVGVKKLLALIDMARQMEGEYRVAKFLSKLEEEGTLEMQQY